MTNEEINKAVKTQTRNYHRNRFIYFNGERLVLQDWADKLGLPRNTLRNRLVVLGWSIEKALSTPKRKTTIVETPQHAICLAVIAAHQK